MSDYTNTKSVKTCSRCQVQDIESKFIKNRNICKLCNNRSNNEKRKNYLKNMPTEGIKTCNTCGLEKHISNYLFNNNMCGECRNKKRCNHYRSNLEFKEEAIQRSILYKKKKLEEKNAIKERELKELEEKIGAENTICKYCGLVKNKSRFRYNRLKCRECERDEPIHRIIRNVRSRILSSLETKTEHLVTYLGCCGKDYYNWLKYSNSEYKNGDGIWHIDHVIPVSHFDLNNLDEQMIAFNWRNTMPLIAKDNLSKNNKIIASQIEEHVKKLEQFHIDNKIEFKNEFRELFAKHLVVRETP